jgi:hypothetical protein
MSVLRAIASFFGIHPAPERPVRHLTLVHDEHTLDVQSAEVDNERQRYSAERYIDHLLACEGGDRTGFREWSMYLLRMQAERPDDYAHFMSEVDVLMESGRWHTVLTPEDKAKAAQAAYEKRFEIIAGLEKRGETFGIAASAANRMVSDLPLGEAVIVQDDPTTEELLGLPAWPDISGEEYEENFNEPGDER